ncbi:hypothetical protein C9994_13635, partial [Marivirga lumbricoides]
MLLLEDLKCLDLLIKTRLQELQLGYSIGGGTVYENYNDFPDDPYAKLLAKAGLNSYERTILILALACYIKPEVLDALFARNERTNSNYTQLGGKTSQNTSAFLPTGETAVFLCGGHQLEARISFQKAFDADQPLYRYNLVHLQPVPDGEPPLSGRIVPTEECLQYIISGKEFKPTYNSNFPAQLLSTPLDWEDLVLPYDTHEALNELDAWLGHHHDLTNMPQISKKFKRGYRALFHGPSGTGKTLTASLLGKKYELDVYHIDLSMMVSKYIGETEKNLKSVFDIAEN